jgi:hypothetical protein
MEADIDLSKKKQLRDETRPCLPVGVIKIEGHAKVDTYEH